MVSIANVLSVVFIFRIPVWVWRKHALNFLKNYFREYGDIRKEGSGMNSAQRAAQPKGEIFLQSTCNCGLKEMFDKLFCEHNFVVFSASCEEKDDKVTLRFMLCPDRDIEWDNPRPFKEMTEVLGQVCAMASYRTMGYNNQYLKEGRDPDQMRALSINSDQPDWLLDPNGQPILAGESQSPKKAERHLTITENGEFELVFEVV